MEEQQQQPETGEYVNDLLYKLCDGNRDLFFALSRFVLLNPERQVGELDNIDRLIQQGKEEDSRHNSLKARVNFDEAAKLSLYYGDAKRAEQCLKLSEEVTGDPNFAKSHQVLLSNLAKVMKITKSYYKDDTRKELVQSEDDAETNRLVTSHEAAAS
jgi:hypothetical protein